MATNILQKTLHEEIYNSYSSPGLETQNDQIKDVELGRAYSMHWEKRDAYRYLVGNANEKRSLAKDGRRLDNIKIDFRRIGRRGMYWIDLAQNMGPVAGYCEDGNEHLGPIWESAGSSRRTQHQEVTYGE